MFIVAPMMISKFSFVFCLFIAFLLGILGTRVVYRLQGFINKVKKFFGRAKKNMEEM